MLLMKDILIIHDVSNIFPVAFYFMAALVTFVTMGRFVEEERGKAGIFNALGYSNCELSINSSFMVW